MASSDLNMVALVGRLTRDAELKYLGSGSAVVNLSIAVNRSKKEGDQWISEANFFDVTYFGKGAEAVSKYLLKGKQIAVQGSLRQSRWEKDGQKFSKVSIQADSVELLGGASSSGSSSYSGEESGSFGGYQQKPSFTPQSSGFDSSPDTFGGDSSGFPDGIPF